MGALQSNPNLPCLLPHPRLSQRSGLHFDIKILPNRNISRLRIFFRASHVIIVTFHELTARLKLNACIFFIAPINPDSHFRFMFMRQLMRHRAYIHFYLVKVPKALELKEYDNM